MAEEFSSKVIQLVELHIPRTTGTNHLRASGNQIPVRQSAARHILADISNLSAVVSQAVIVYTEFLILNYT